MTKRVVVTAGTIALLIAAARPAGATCTPGSIGLKPKPHVELPRCEPYPQ